VNAVEQAEAAAWAGLRECRTDLLGARVWALEAQIRLTVAGSAFAVHAEMLAEKIADAVEHCETVTLQLASDGHEGPHR
jgi:hypothetical protein